MSQFSTILLITHLFFFTSTHPLLLLQFIFLYFYLDFISSTCLPLLSLISFQISKSKSSPYFGQSSREHPKENSKSLRNSREKKKWRRRRTSEEHRRCRDPKKNRKLSRKETEIRERCIRSLNLLRNYLRWVKNYQEICIFVSGRYPFSGRNPVFWPVLPIFKPVPNEIVSVPFQALVRKISTVPASTVRNWLHYN